MNEDRRSKRPSTVNKRIELEEKLNQRKTEAELKEEKSRSEKLLNLHQQELNLFTSEAQRLSETVDRLYTEYLEPVNLEWDSDEVTTSPSFALENSLSDANVNEIVESILKESDEEHEENLDSWDINSAEIFGESRRKNTSTNIGFLDSPEPEQNYNCFNWPPRYPSQEPEDLPVSNPLQVAVVHQDLLDIEEDEVFEVATRMDNNAYVTRYRTVKIASRKVRNKMNTFLADNVTSIHIPDYKDRLREVRSFLDLFSDAVSDLVVDLNEAEDDDKRRIESLETEQANLLQEVLDNEKGVEAKIKELLESQPISKAEQESLDIERKKLQLAEQKEEKVLRGKKVEIDISDISSRIKVLMDNIEKVKPSETLTDQEVKQALFEAKKWEAKLEEITASKVKLDKEMVDLVVDAEIIATLKNDLEKVAKNTKERLEDLTSADKDRRLFSLTKSVKEAAVYPSPFGGTPTENIYKFLDKMFDAFTANQISEKDRVDILKKYLKGFPRTLINESHKTFDQAKVVLLDTYGSPHATWKAKLEAFRKKCDNPKGWSSHGQKVQHELIATTCNFLAEAKQFAEDHKEMAETINSEWTANTVIAVIPRSILQRVYNSNVNLHKATWGEVLNKLKVQMDKENQDALMDNKCAVGVKDNAVAYTF